MDIDDLKAFRTVLEAGGVTAAASLLHVTPSAVSKAVRRFEDEVGHALLKRAGRGVVATRAGRDLYDRSAVLIREHDRLIEEFDARDPESPDRLRLASFEIFASAFAAELVGTHFPAMDVDILDVDFDQIGASVRDREVDYGLTYVPIADPALAFVRLARIEFAIFGLPDAFCDVPFEEIPFSIPSSRVQLSSGERFHIDGWPYRRFSRRVRYRVTALQIGLELASRGQCVIFVPVLNAALHNLAVAPERQLVRKPGAPGLGRVHQSLHLVVRKEDRNDPLTGRLSAAVNATLAKLNRVIPPLPKG